ncbi:hypothetical protein OROMI_013844 [Orobanche minor]
MVFIYSIFPIVSKDGHNADLEQHMRSQTKKFWLEHETASGLFDFAGRDIKTVECVFHAETVVSKDGHNADLEQHMRSQTKKFWLEHETASGLFDFAGRDIKTVECVFHAETGDRIHAQIKKPWVSKHKPMLHEGKLYRMSKFFVALNDIPYSTTGAPFMINICGSTIIYEDPKEDFPNLRFVLKSFADFETSTNIVTFTIIGLVVNLSEPKEFTNKNGRRSTFSDIILEDTENKIGVLSRIQMIRQIITTT